MPSVDIFVPVTGWKDPSRLHPRPWQRRLGRDGDDHKPTRTTADQRDATSICTTADQRNATSICTNLDHLCLTIQRHLRSTSRGGGAAPASLCRAEQFNRSADHQQPDRQV